jgi:uncharacterized membrane protein YdjX (TVP38/TMEM64 family)
MAPAPSTQRVPRWLPLAIVLALFAAFVAAGGLDQARADRVVALYHDLKDHAARHPVLAVAVFVGVYTVLAGMVVFPAAFVVTLTGGLLFGTEIGAAASVLGVTIGGTVSFTVVRTAMADRLHRWLGARGERFRAALERDGFWYLLLLRASPIPFWLVTLAAAAAGFRLRPFLFATLFGVVPPCLVWANVGAGLARAIDEGGQPTLAILASPDVLYPLYALTAFGAVSIMVRYTVQRRARRAAAAE